MVKGKENRLKILMVTRSLPPYRFGGVGIQAIYLAGALLKLGYEVDFFTDNGLIKSVRDKYRNMDFVRVQTYFKGQNSISTTIYAIKLLFFILTNRRKRYDVIHFHAMSGLEMLTFPIIKIMGKKIIVKMTLVDSDDLRTLSQRKLGFLFKRCFNFVDMFIPISTKLKELALESGISKQKIHYIPNGVDLERFCPVLENDKQKLKSELNFDKFKYIFLSIGKVEPRKGYDFLLEAWKNLALKFSSCALLIIGPGNEDSNYFYQQLLSFIERNKLKTVFFLGQIADVAPYFKISDCFLFCSHREGFGTILVEAIASNVPVVCKNIEGVTEDIIKYPEIGRICYSNIPEEFSNLAVEILNETDNELKTRRFSTLRSIFDINSIALDYDRIYQRLLA